MKYKQCILTVSDFSFFFCFYICRSIITSRKKEKKIGRKEKGKKEGKEDQKKGEVVYTLVPVGRRIKADTKRASTKQAKYIMNTFYIRVNYAKQKQYTHIAQNVHK